MGSVTNFDKLCEAIFTTWVREYAGPIKKRRDQAERDFAAAFANPAAIPVLSVVATAIGIEPFDVLCNIFDRAEEARNHHNRKQRAIKPTEARTRNRRRIAA